MSEFYWESRGEEYWGNNGPYPTREAAVEAGEAELGPGAKLQTGIREDCCATEFVSVDVARILENMAYAASEQVGEVAEGWPDLSNEEEMELEGLLEATTKKFFEERNLEPSFWKIIQIHDHTGDGAK